MPRELHDLSPNEAAERALTDPEGVVFPLPTFGLKFGLTDNEVLGELIAGRLMANGPTNYKVSSPRELWDIAAVSFPAVVKWLSSESPAARKALAKLCWER